MFLFVFRKIYTSSSLGFLLTVAEAPAERYVNIPSFVFRDRTLAALEATVVYLKETQGLTYAQIGRLLNRDQRTVWTSYQRAVRKRR